MVARPLQTLVAPLTLTVNEFTTLTVATAVLPATQPLASVPVKLYDASAEGVTVKVPPVMVYVFAPEGINVNELPGQTAPLLMDTVGIAFTTTVEIAVFDDTQPLVPVPVTAYVPVTAGLTMSLPPLIVYVLAPPGIMVAEPPAQMVGLFTVIVGKLCTLTSTVVELMQLLASDAVTV